MSNPLSNPFIRIALGAAISEYVKPKIINHFVRPELDERDERINMQTAIGITAAVTATVFVLLGMATGQTAAKSAAVGGA
jgi:hypothetical protein